MKLRYGQFVRDDLLQIADYLAERGMERPERFLQELQMTCRGLAEMPHRFAFVPGHEADGIRHRVIGNYVIFYHVTDGAVVILRIRHGASDYDDLLVIDDKPSR